MSPTDLLSFTEVAAELDVTTERVRRYVVEDRTLEVLRIDAKGSRIKVNLDVLFQDDAWRVDDKGVLFMGAPIFVQGRLVGIEYKPMPAVGELRVERAELDRYSKGRDASQPSVLAEKPAVFNATRSGSSAISPGLPCGLSPMEIAEAFAGIFGTERQWCDRLAKTSAKWLTTAPVVMRKGFPGRGPKGQVPALRNPVELAKLLVQTQKGTFDQCRKAFRRQGTLEAWRNEWKAYCEQRSDYFVD